MRGEGGEGRGREGGRGGETCVCIYVCSEVVAVRRPKRIDGPVRAGSTIGRRAEEEEEEEERSERRGKRLGTRVVAVRRSVGYLRVVGHTLGRCRLAMLAYVRFALVVLGYCLRADVSRVPS